MDSKELYSLYKANPRISTDSRIIEPGSIFFALHGKNFDGNQFAEDAIQKGCRFAIIDDKKYVLDNRYILVKNTLEALQQLANYHRKQLQTTIIAITGTNGKTTTKELLAKVLGTKYNVFATKGNLNNHIGVPLSLLSIHNNEEFGIIEMGANHIGEISSLCNIAEPDCGIITNIGHAHTEGFGSIEGVKKAKKELYDYLAKHNGLVFYNEKNEVLRHMVDQSNLRTISYGNQNSEYLQVKILKADPLLSIKLSSKNNGWDHTIKTQLYGSYNLENILCAVGIACYYEIEIDQIIGAIESYSPDNNRSQVIKTSKNTLVIDCYNANPSSMVASINSFINLHINKKMIILGDMLELGKESKSEHLKILNLLEDNKLEYVCLVGKIFSEITKNKSWKVFETVDKLTKWLINQDIRSTCILLKGSRQIQLERVIKYL